jgi:hypothetical protein
VIDPRFIYLGSLISLSGGAVYVRDTWLGRTAPNRVTWALWGLEPLLAFGVERQEHVGLASVMALVLGVVPIVVLAASFHDSRSVWRIGRFDLVCGALSVAGLALWVVSNQPTVALVAFITADAIAGLPTLRKSYVDPSSESWWTYGSGAIFAVITLLVVPRFATADVLFAFSVLTMNVVLCFLLLFRLGPRLRARSLRSKGRIPA